MVKGARDRTSGARMFAPWPVFPREDLIDIPSLGDPTLEERSWRRHAATMTSRQRKEAIYRARSLAEWGSLLLGARGLEEALRAVRYLRHIVAEREHLLVTACREQGMCWDEVGVSLGLTRHAVRKRWLRREERAARASIERGDERP